MVFNVILVDKGFPETAAPTGLLMEGFLGEVALRFPLKPRDLMKLASGCSGEATEMPKFTDHPPTVGTMFPILYKRPGSRKDGCYLLMTNMRSRLAWI